MDWAAWVEYGVALAFLALAAWAGWGKNRGHE